MNVVKIVAGVTLVFLILWDTFETIIVPRTLMRALRFTRFFYLSSWAVWKRLVQSTPLRRRRAVYLGAYGPLSLLLLITLWSVGLIIGFGLIQWGLRAVSAGPGEPAPLPTSMYLSGTTLYTLGLGDVTPHTRASRIVTVMEAALGLTFFAVVISYLPVFYQAYARREAGITSLYTRAGTPPSATNLLRRYGERQQMEACTTLLGDWESWSIDLLNTFLSYPMLALYRSHRDVQSWLATVVTMLDTCALVQLGFQNAPAWLPDLVFQAEITFAVALQVIDDFVLLFGVTPPPALPNRLSLDEWVRVRSTLAAAGLALCADTGAETRLTELRQRYEPYVAALAETLLISLPAWGPSYTAPAAVPARQQDAGTNLPSL